MFERYYCEWSVNLPISVRDRVTGQRYWFSDLTEESQTQALSLPKFDVNRKRFVLRRGN